MNRKTSNHYLKKNRNSPRDGSVATVFYDGSCKLCSREIEHYRKVRGSDKILWIDIRNSTELLTEYNLDPKTALARFHVLDSRGKWHTGARGFSELWSHLAYYRWLAKILNALHLLPLVEIAYRQFAQWRLDRQCNTVKCGQLE